MFSLKKSFYRRLPTSRLWRQSLGESLVHAALALKLLGMKTFSISSHTLRQSEDDGHILQPHLRVGKLNYFT